MTAIEKHESMFMANALLKQEMSYKLPEVLVKPKNSGSVRSFFNLIPQSPSTVLETAADEAKALKGYLFFLSNILITINEFFMEKNYTLFDPHVGDNLCQIRAIQLLEIACTENDFSPIEITKLIKEKLINCIVSLSLASQKTGIKKSKDERRLQKKTLEKIFNRKELKLCIPKEIEYLLKVFLLHKYKYTDANGHYKIDVSTLANETGFSYTMSKNMIRNWQKSISEFSCKYILKSSYDKSLVQKFKKIDDDGRSVLPSFLVMDHVVQKLMLRHYPIKMWISNPEHPDLKPLLMCFKYNIDRYVVSENISSKHGYFTLNCVSTLYQNGDNSALFKKIEAIGLFDLLKCCTANHPQYNGSKLDHYNCSNIYSRVGSCLQALSIQYRKYFILAKEIHCEYKNPNFIFIEHIYFS